jgi:hypothetical protein
MILELIILIAILVFVGGITYILKRGFNEIIKGLESIDERLKKIEEKKNSQNPT